jgi:hypothetical protein
MFPSINRSAYQNVNWSEFMCVGVWVWVLQVRQELAAILYASNILVSRGPRKMTVLLPTYKADGSRHVMRPMKDEESMYVCARARPRSFALVLCVCVCLSLSLSCSGSPV